MKNALTLQEKLWELRKDRKLTLAQLSESTGISLPAL